MALTLTVPGSSTAVLPLFPSTCSWRSDTSHAVSIGFLHLLSHSSSAEDRRRSVVPARCFPLILHPWEQLVVLRSPPATSRQPQPSPFPRRTPVSLLPKVELGGGNLSLSDLILTALSFSPLFSLLLIAQHHRCLLTVL